MVSSAISFLLFSFSITLLSILSYIKAYYAKDENEQHLFKRIGRYAFVTQCMGVFAMVGILLYAMINKHYEYFYVFLSCFRPPTIQVHLFCTLGRSGR